MAREALRAARKAAGLTVNEAARRAGYKSKSGWSMVENGYNEPAAGQMKLMAQVVGRRAKDVFPEMRDEEDATGGAIG